MDFTLQPLDYGWKISTQQLTSTLWTAGHVPVLPPAFWSLTPTLSLGTTPAFVHLHQTFLIELMDNNYTSVTEQFPAGRRCNYFSITGKWCILETNMVVAKPASYFRSDEDTELCLLFFNKRRNLMCRREGKKSIEMLTYLNQWWKGCTTWLLLPFHHCYK